MFPRVIQVKQYSRTLLDDYFLFFFLKLPRPPSSSPVDDIASHLSEKIEAISRGLVPSLLSPHLPTCCVGAQHCGSPKCIPITSRVSCALDSIPSRLLKDMISAISLPLSCITNFSRPFASFP